MHFTGQGRAIRKRPEASVVVPPLDRTYTKFHACFTRGYISSQAYADKFTNAEIRPAGPKTPDFNTKPYQPQYVWLGAGARAELFAFLDDCRSDKSSKVNVRLAISPGSSTTSWGVASRRRQCHTLACSGNMPRKETRLAAGSVAPGSSHRLLRRASITSSI
jgi:hypothetical protein